MKVTDLTDSPQIQDILELLRDEGPFVVSDVMDAAGHQYVDLVQQGGGVWGIALLGYTYVLEQMGIRFVSLGGTSAGAINTLLLAAVGNPAEAKTKQLVNILSGKDFSEFIDGNWRAQRLVRAINRKAGKLSLAFWGLMNLGNLRRHWGLNPGHNFMNWLEELLVMEGIRNTQDLTERMNAFPPDLHFRPGKVAAESPIDARLAVIAADLSTRTKVEFPRMAPLYFQDPDAISPSNFARASMSIPIFFSPVKVEGIPRSQAVWKELADYHGPIPHAAVIVDGGIMSNFPIDVFHARHRIPTRPTFGVKLGFGRSRPSLVNGYGSVIGASFSAARNIRDQQFIQDHPDFRQLVATIDTHGFDWMNFNVTDTEKLALFLRGAEAARDFLLRFDWEGYKKTRRQGAEMVFERAADALGLDTAALRVAIQHAMDSRGQFSEVEAASPLMRRINEVHQRGISFSVLWVVDDPEDNFWELGVLRSIGIKLDLVRSSAEARKRLAEKKYDLVLSDISRNGNKTEGLEFHQALIAENIDIPTIFYIEDLDRSRGTPPFALAITSSPEEVIHLVLDQIERTQN